MSPSIEKARTLLGYGPSVDLRDGIERTVAWYRQALMDATPGDAR
jgi:nucleoside-diphosphate-sugar epimerase